MIPLWVPTTRLNIARESAIWCQQQARDLAIHRESLVADYWQEYRLWRGPESPAAEPSEPHSQVRLSEAARLGHIACLGLELIASVFFAVTFFNGPMPRVILGLLLPCFLEAGAQFGLSFWIGHR